MAVEMFKDSRGLSPEIVNELFQFRDQISQKLRIHWVLSLFSDIESLKVLETKVWALVSNEINKLERLGEFRNAIKQ